MRKKLLISSLSFCSNNHNLNPKSNYLSFEVCSSVGLSNVQCRGWSYAAATSLSSEETSNVEKSRKRVPKHERRAMVESFVNKYRSENAGKFPKINYVKKQVGGDYYVVRKIVQELAYKSKMKSSNNMDQILVEKRFDESKLKTTVSLNISSGNVETAKYRSIQDDSKSVLLDDKETVNTGYEHLEEKRGPQTSSWKGRLSNEVEIISTPGNHCIASESNLVEKCSKEPNSSSVQMPNDVKTEEAVSSHSDSGVPETQLLQEEMKRASTPFYQIYGTSYGKTQGHQSEFADLKNLQKMEEKCIEEAGYERREQPALEDQSDEALHSNPQVPIHVKCGEAVSSCPSDSIAPEGHLPKVEPVSATYFEKSNGSHSEGQSHDSKLVDMENNPAIEEKSFEKAGHERKEQVALEDFPGVDSPKHKMEQSHGSLESDESKIDGSNHRETSVAVVSKKSTMWGNLKSFADGIMNIWRKL